MRASACRRLHDILGEDIISTRITKSAKVTLPSTPPVIINLADDHFDLDAWYGAMIRSALAHCNHSPVRTAEYLGITRKVLYTLRKRYGLLES